MKRWMYRGGHPNAVARAMNWFWAQVHALGIAPNLAVTMEVTGRHSGRMISLPLAMVVLNGERYVVSMLGANAEWVRNVRAGLVLYKNPPESLRAQNIIWILCESQRRKWVEPVSPRQAGPAAPEVKIKPLHRRVFVLMPLSSVFDQFMRAFHQSK